MPDTSDAHPQRDALTLRTPGPSPSEHSSAHALAEPCGEQVEKYHTKTEDALLTAASRAFSFPYPQAYKIQVELMREVFRCVEDRKIGIFESPTGTGKSLSLICSLFTWLEQNNKRSELGSSSSRPSDHEKEDTEPDWVVAHALSREREAAGAAERDLKARVARAKKLQARFKKERKSASASTTLSAHERAQNRKVDGTKRGKGAGESDNEFLLDYDSDADGAVRRNGKGNEDGELAAFLGRNKSTEGADSSVPEDDLFLSAEVKALMAQYKSSSSTTSASHAVTGADGRSTAWRAGTGEAALAMEEMLALNTTPKVYYTSRTHSQLSQFAAELKKTRFGKVGGGRVAESAGQRLDNGVQPSQGGSLKRPRVSIALECNDGELTDDETDLPARVIALGSRKQMCINESVQKVGRAKGTEAMNERCKELLKGKKKQGADEGGKKSVEEKRCAFAPSLDEDGLNQVLDFRDHAFTTVRDIEDLTQLGRSLNTCPYFASRVAAKQAELVTLPYNLLLHADARSAAEIDVKANIIVVDEAHNLIDTILDAHTVTITLAQLKQAHGQIQTYVEKFAAKLKGSNEMHLKQMLLALKNLLSSFEKWCTEPKPVGKAKEEVISASQLVGKVGGTMDQVNLAHLRNFLRDSQIARKVSGYADKQAEKARMELMKHGDASSIEHRSNIASMHAISNFLLSLAHADRDGKILLSLASNPASRVRPNASASDIATPKLVITYQLLNPSKSFSMLVDEARSIVLAGGTMEPVSDLLMQVFPQVPPHQIARISCGHVIPSSNLLARVLPVGPRKRALEFKFESRDDHSLIDELGSTLVNFASMVPDGVVVFLPSYKALASYTERWKQSGQLNSLGKKKKVFYEPQLATEVEAVLRGYTAAIETPSPGQTGALLFAVVGAKLSEGINFSDRLARAVIMVGLPFANAASAELAERMRFARDMAKRQPTAANAGDAGQELYINMCMKAVNQSIGRAIRHRDDFAALILLDARYGRKNIQSKLPGWIRDEVKTAQAFPSVMRDLHLFFSSKRVG